MELYKKYRPGDLQDLHGNSLVVKSLGSMLKGSSVPHALLLSGPSGTGKTTVARILQRKLGCSQMDFQELNAADFRGIDTVRDIRSRLSLHPMAGSCRIWLIDECHKLTNDAQTALLKMLEDCPTHVYFFLATTELGKVIPTIQTRCSSIKMGLLNHSQMQGLLEQVIEAEEAEIGEEVLEAIVEASGGSPRKALVLLEQVVTFKGDDEQALEFLVAVDVKEQAIGLARELISPVRKWSKVAAILKGLEEEPEAVRHLVLGYASSVLLAGGKLAPRAFIVVECFRDNFFDSKRAGLIAACYEACHHV